MNSIRISRQSFSGVILLIVIFAVTFVPLLYQRHREASQAVWRTKAKGDLLQILLAVRDYALIHGELPRVAVGSKAANGPSWRVAILPHLGEESLYKRFHTDEPWNSQNNLPLSHHCPNVFRDHSLYELGVMSNYIANAKDGVWQVQVDDVLRRRVTGELRPIVYMADIAGVWSAPFDDMLETHGAVPSAVRTRCKTRFGIAANGEILTYDGQEWVGGAQ